MTFNVRYNESTNSSSHIDSITRCRGRHLVWDCAILRYFKKSIKSYDWFLDDALVF